MSTLVYTVSDTVPPGHSAYSTAVKTLVPLVDFKALEGHRDVEGVDEVGILDIQDLIVATPLGSLDHNGNIGVTLMITQ